MASMKLHFNVFGQGCSCCCEGSGTEGRRSIHIEDPLITVGALKNQLFREACEEQKVIRFIASGRVLEDKLAIGQCGLGEEAHIHVAISGQPSTTAVAASAGDGGSHSTAAKTDGGGTACESKGGSASLDLGRMLVAVLLLGGGLLLCLAWQRRRRLSMCASQLLCILAACWVYLAIFHALPALLGLLGSHLHAALRSSPRGPGAQQTASSTVPAVPLFRKEMRAALAACRRRSD